MTPNGELLLEADHLVHHFPVPQGAVRAVDDVSLAIAPGETVGLVGESGCGKTTLARCLLRLLEPTAGRVRFRGLDVTHARRRALHPLRRGIQMIFQDPYASLNPRKRVGQIVGDPIRVHGIASGPAVEDRVRELLTRVGLNPEHYNRYPHEFSGGQRQRIGVARALALAPQLVIADEPVSALDVSIQAQILNLLGDIQHDLGLAFLFISHDLAVVRHVSDRIAVMYLGKLVEISSADELYAKPIHPYTEALLSAIPIPDPRANAARERIVLQGEVPSSLAPPSACRFHTRCPRATDLCARVEPPLVDYGTGHLAACHHPVGVTAEEMAGATIARASPGSAGDVLPGAP